MTPAISAPPPEFLRLSQRLSSLKGIAILLVVMYHLWGSTQGYFTWAQITEAAQASGIKGWVEGGLNSLCLLGQQGVHFFLIASGFGLTASWWQKRSNETTSPPPIALLPFWKRRLTRIFPLYWFAHLIAIALFWIHPAWVPYGHEIWSEGGGRIVTALLASLTTLRNFLPTDYFFLNGAWWYVGLSVQLYVIFPWLIRLGQRYGWSQLLLSSLAVSWLYRGGVIALIQDPKVMDRLIRGAIFPSRLFEFVLGITLAIALLHPKSSPILTWLRNMMFHRKLLSVSIVFYGAGLFCAWTALPHHNILLIPADALIGIGEFCLLFQLLSVFPWDLSLLNWLGDRSYGIYLTHMNLYNVLWFSLTQSISNYWLHFLWVLFLSLGLGGIVDLAFHALEKRLFQRS